MVTTPIEAPAKGGRGAAGRPGSRPDRAVRAAVILAPSGSWMIRWAGDPPVEGGEPQQWASRFYPMHVVEQLVGPVLWSETAPGEFTAREWH